MQGLKGGIRGMCLEIEQGHDTDWFRAGTEIRAQEYVLGDLQGQKVDSFSEELRRWLRTICRGLRQVLAPA